MTDYDDFANAYSTANENNLLNAWYERPAMIKLVGTSRDGTSWTPAAGQVPWARPCVTGALS